MKKTIILILLTSLVFAQTGPTYDTFCEQGVCELTSYSYVKYYWDNAWLPISEDISDQGCGNYDYCVKDNLYEAYFSDAGVKVVDDNVEVEFNLVRTNALTSANVVVEDNKITFENIFGSADLRFTYLPTRIKEDIILGNSPARIPSLRFALTLPQNGVFQSNGVAFQLTANQSPFILSRPSSLTVNGVTQLVFERPFVKDANDDVLFLNASLSFNGSSTLYEVLLDEAWLQNATYPVIIDPTVTLNYSNMSWDGYVYFDALIDFNPYTRASTPSTLEVGQRRGSAGIPDQTYRSVLEFDISSIPETSVIQELNLSVYVSSGAAPNTNVSVYHMEKNNTDYDTGQNGCEGNCQFWQDMANGTEYLNTILMDSATNYLDVISAAPDFEDALQNQNWFGFGLASLNGEGNASNNLRATRISGSTHDTQSERPTLTVTYFVSANESEGRDAIDLGINQSALGSTNPRVEDQLIYVVHRNGTHYTGNFDKYTEKNNQSWPINYVTPGENFTNIPSLFNILNVGEQTKLTAETITNLVSFFINITIE